MLHALVYTTDNHTVSCPLDVLVARSKYWKTVVTCEVRSKCIQVAENINKNSMECIASLLRIKGSDPDCSQEDLVQALEDELTIGDLINDHVNIVDVINLLDKWECIELLAGCRCRIKQAMSSPEYNLPIDVHCKLLCAFERMPSSEKFRNEWFDISRWRMMEIMAWYRDHADTVDPRSLAAAGSYFVSKLAWDIGKYQDLHGPLPMDDDADQNIEEIDLVTVEEDDAMENNDNDIDIGGVWEVEVSNGNLSDDESVDENSMMSDHASDPTFGLSDVSSSDDDE